MGAQNQRPRFYEGQYLGADDLAAVVEYLKTADARHGLGAHTWGIAIGLYLTEKTSPGAPDRVEVTLQPGCGWDGFDRPLVNPRPTRLPESLFADIPYHPTLDDVSTGGKGRLVPIWLAYDELAAGNPPPGFETCATDDQHSRITETLRFVVGAQTDAQQRSSVTIGTVSVDAQKALQTFDPAAPLLFDTSVPQQTFPIDGKPPRWLVPLGYVRWIARDQALGYFAGRDLNPSDNATDRIRAVRRYVGAVAEYIESADGAIVLHRRGERPNLAHRFANLLQGGFKAADLLKDLVWVEGNLRVEGDAKLAAGQLQFRNGDGLDEKTPLYIARAGDNPAGGNDGQREMRLVIGDTSQTDNRLVIGPQQPGASPPTIAPRLVVVSDGKVGIGRSDPETRLNVVGERIRLQDVPMDPAKKIDLRTTGNDVGIESPTDTLTVRAFGTGAAKRRVLINPNDTDGSVGLRVQTPAHDVDAKGRSIKLGLEADGGGQLVLTHDAADKVFLEGRNATGATPAAEVRIVGPGGANVPLVSSHADLTYVTNRLSVGVAAPAHDVDIRGNRIKLGLEATGGGQLVLVNNLNDNRIYLEGFSSDGTSDATEMLVTGRWANPIPLFTARATTTQFTGNVGIGTPTPQERLHVAGDVLRVDGPANEQSIFGGEGHDAVTVGARNANVRYADMRRLGVGWDTGNANAWLTVYCRSVVEVSDARAKTNVRPITGALARVLRLRGVAYDWKGESRDGAPSGHLGLLAHEVQDVVPQAVGRDERGGLSYSTFVPLLIEAIKELKADIDALRGDVARLPGSRAVRAAVPDVPKGDQGPTRKGRRRGKPRE